MIKVLTIEREYGSGAATIAHRLAEKLGWKLWDQAITDEVARHLECDRRHVEHQEERRDPLHYRLLKSFMRGSFEGSLNAPKMKIADTEGIRKVTEQLVRKAADEGNAVIVGRGAAYYLHDCENAFRTFVYAPFDDKVQRLQSEGKSQAQAMELVENVDSDRTVFIKEHFGIDWPARHLFHLMVNSTIGEEMVVDIILGGLAAAKKGKLPGMSC
jgi:cytidylate kinase